MAFASTDVTQTSSTNGIAGFFRAIGAALISMSEANTRIRRVEALCALSDAQLKERGIRREDIVRHVFSDALYI